MKKLITLLLAIALVFALAACGDSGKTPSGGTDKSGESWPTITYIKDTDKYTGDGKITQVKQWTLPVRTVCGRFIMTMPTNQPVAFISVTTKPSVYFAKDPDYAYIGRLAVASELWQQGLGDLCISRAVQYAQKKAAVRFALQSMIRVKKR